MKEDNKDNLSYLHEITLKEKKYDRQLRLWQADGQEALESAEILLINSGPGAVGIETLKNLVLPGVGKFTIIDQSAVSEADLGVNFFLDESCLGNSRAECCTKFLGELNPDVQGEFHSTLDVAYLQSLFEKRLFSLVICTFPIQADVLSYIMKYTFRTETFLMLVHSLGFYSYFRSIVPKTFPIVDTHPDAEAAVDLGLLSPWGELSQFSRILTKDIQNLSDHKHGHIPYVSILLHYLEEWNKINGKFPSTYSEKLQFKKMVAAGARDNIEGGEENFDEAVAAVMKTIKNPSISCAVREVFEYQPDHIEAKSSFWIIANAVKQFFKRNGRLPLPGSLPDMKAESDVYIQLQRIYKEKAVKDALEVYEDVIKNPQGKIVPKVDVEKFCKNAAHIKLIHGLDEHTTNLKNISKTEFENDEAAVLTSQPLSLFPIYLALRANSYVSMTKSSDIITVIEKEIPEADSNYRIRAVSEEVARANGGELHNISALTGGMVAQEIIKIITKQYIPIDNTCIFDGIASRVQILKI